MKYLFILILAIAISSCKKPDEYPIDPVISYYNLYTTKDALNRDSKLSLILDFTDGDGDIGYKESGNGFPYDDPTSIYNKNFYGVFYKFINGSWTHNASWDSLFVGRIPYLTPEGKNKALKGQIQYDFQLQGFPANNDTCRMEVFIYDRGFHKSNVVNTPNFTLKTQ